MSNKVDFNDLKNIDYGFNKLSKLNQKPVLFVGSGLSQRYLKSPTWWGLLEKISEELEIDESLLERWTSDNYEEIAERLEAICFTTLKKESLLESDDIRRPFRELIAQILNEYTVDNSEYEKEISILGGIDYQKLITTNYDSLLEKSVFNIENEEIYIHNDNLFSSETKNKKLYKIHGSIDKPSSMIITKSDYDQFFEKSKYIYSKLLTMFVESPIIFLGYSLSDRNIKDILTTLTATLSQKDLKQFQERVYIVSYSSDDKPEYFLEKEDLPLLNGSSLKVNIFYLRNSYLDLYKVLRQISIKSSNLEFSVSKDDVINHFIVPLYKGMKEQEVAMRELLQNSMDACKIAKNKYDIKISLKKDKSGKILLSVKDNGVGMSLDDIKNYYLTIGKSGKKSESNIENLVGKFGIGALSMFLVSDFIYVQTKKSGDTPISFRMYTNNTSSNKEVKLESNMYPFNEDSYTYIELELKEKLKSEIEKLDKIDEYLRYFNLCDVIRGGSIEFEVDFKGINHSFRQLNMADFRCISEEPYKIYMYSKSDSDTKKNSVFHKLANHILFGDMLVEYSYSPADQLMKITDVPLIILEKTHYIGVPLNRENIELSESIQTLVVNEYYKLKLPQFFERLDLICEEGKLPKADSYSEYWVNYDDMQLRWYVKNNKVYIPRLDTNILQILSNKVDYIVKNAFSNEKIITSRYTVPTNFNISLSITDRNILALSRNYIDENLINIKNYRNGFWVSAIKEILNHFGFSNQKFDKLSSASQIKDYIMKHKTEIVEFFEKHYSNNILWFDKKYREYDLKIDRDDYLYISRLTLRGNGSRSILTDIINEKKYNNIILD